MTTTHRRLLLGVPAAALLAFPATAAAHGIVGRADLPIPPWLFGWTASIVLVVSFVALSTMWTKPQLQDRTRRRLFALPAPVPWLLPALGVFSFVLVVYAGLAGEQSQYNENLAVTFVYVIFWVGVPVCSAFVGDLFAGLSPWLATARLIRWIGRRVAPARFEHPPLRYPERLGRWPSIFVLLGFGFLELVYVNRDQPSTLAWLGIAYFIVMVAGMLLFGVETWTGRADGFNAYFGTVARLSALEWREGVCYYRRPLSGITDLEMLPGTITLVCTLIGVTTFDGASNGPVWHWAEPKLVGIFGSQLYPSTPAIEIAGCIGLLVCVLLIHAIYYIGVYGVNTVSARYDVPRLSRTFAHTLVPIGFAYALAHYFSLLVWQGQALGYLISDPLGNGSNVLGTSHWSIDYGIISFAAIWYVQVAALLAGHVGGLTLAHDRALAIYRNPQEAVRSQYWMLVVMVAFTSFGLWLLSAVGT
ncbi:MAG TPA: fenitrothion hydrolase [Solirubrobacteraceae bacterium]|jgi:hypothetical protein|nr:fenitrothion hydrolase [Solirubrobacteraceae bacterium]